MVKHLFSVRHRLRVVLLFVFVAAFGGTAAPLRAQAEIVQTRTEPASIADLANEIRQYRARGELNVALAKAKHLVDLVERQEGQSGANYAQALSLQGTVLYELGQYSEAEPLFRRALALNTKVRGEKHPDTIISLINLAVSFDRQGRYAESEPIRRRALALRTEVLGEKHPDTISSLNNLASSLNELGRAAEAEPLYRRALALSTEVLGEKHPVTISILANLANNLDSLGRYAEAEPLYRRALALNTEVRGEKHPDTISNLNNLAGDLDGLGRYAEAEPLYRRALALRTEVLGEKDRKSTRLNSSHLRLSRMPSSA